MSLVRSGGCCANLLKASNPLACRALHAVQRNNIAETTHIEQEKSLIAGYGELPLLSIQVHELLPAGETDAAVELFEAEAAPLRRNLTNQAYSASREIQEIIRGNGLDARLDR